MKITDAIISIILKKGILYEAHNCDIGFEIPASILDTEGEPEESKIKIQFKADNMTIRIERSNG